MEMVIRTCIEFCIQGRVFDCDRYYPITRLPNNSPFACPFLRPKSAFAAAVLREQVFVRITFEPPFLQQNTTRVIRPRQQSRQDSRTRQGALIVRQGAGGRKKIAIHTRFSLRHRRSALHQPRLLFRTHEVSSYAFFSLRQHAAPKESFERALRYPWPISSLPYPMLLPTNRLRAFFSHIQCPRRSAGPAISPLRRSSEFPWLFTCLFRYS